MERKGRILQLQRAYIPLHVIKISPWFPVATPEIYSPLYVQAAKDSDDELV